MNRINKVFKSLRKKRRKAMVVYITAGDPSLRATEKLIIALEKSGVDMVELGIPFSDPLADGPTIQKASERAISNGADMHSILGMAKKARKKAKLPLVFMTYYNLVLHYGIRRFIEDSVKSGVDGLIVPDLPPEEADELLEAARKKKFSIIFLAAPTSTKDRLKRIASGSRGFIYYVSLTGVTGARKRLPADIVENVKHIKRLTKKPVCVGFGVSSPAQAKRISRLADGVIVGSAVIKVIEKNLGKKDMAGKVGRFARGLARAVHGK